MGLLLSAYLLYAITQAEKQKNKLTNIKFFNNIYASDLHIIQYYNIYKTVIIMMIII